MNHSLKFGTLLLVGLLLAAPMTTPNAVAIDTDEHTAEPAPFQPSSTVMADISGMLSRAKTSGKLGMVVMGANWCHDSQAFVKRLHSPEMKPVLDKSYEYILVDVGALDKGREVINRFGMPVIYGTPTVLVIDPNNEHQLNRESMHQWRNAYSITPADTAAHFLELASKQHGYLSSLSSKHPAEKKALEAIDTFENEQAERIYAGFEIIGPMIVMERDKRPEEFSDLWNELRDFRYQITEDLKALRDKARKAGTDPDFELSFPAYEPFSWEK